MGPGNGVKRAARKPHACTRKCLRLGVSRNRMGNGAGMCRICDRYVMYNENRRCPCCEYPIRTRVSGVTAKTARSRRPARQRTVKE